MRPLKPALSRIQELGRNVGGVFGALGSGRVPGARYLVRAVREGILVVEYPLTATYDSACRPFNGVDVVRTTCLLVFGPLKVCVCGLVFGAVLWCMAIDGVENDEGRSRGRVGLIRGLS